jgi:hypothetical protein
LPTHTAEADVFNLINLYVAEKGLSWKLRIDICIDGALSMVGETRGFTAHVEATAP